MMRTADCSSRVRAAALLAMLVIASGCGYSRTAIVPEAMVEKAAIAGIPHARFWGDQLPPWFHDSLVAMHDQLAAAFTDEEMRLPSNYLVISGGGEDGAFAAGILNGWTASGTRPPFLVVTGISTGALIAPFAFAGPEYDETLHRLYTSVSTRDIAAERSTLSMLYSDSMADSAPLRALIEQYVDADLIAAIARKSEEGRRLFVGTTNLDAERPVIWDITEIAASGAPGSLDLIRNVLLASASIPGVFPPVYIDVEVDGKRYREMHVDGGATHQLFLYPAALDWRQAAKDLELDGRHRLYIIRNGFIDPVWEVVRPTLSSIGFRAIHSLIRTQARGDLYRLYLGAQRDGIEYYLAHMPKSFVRKPTEDFDRDYMTALYRLGYDSAVGGVEWKREPPGFHAPAVQWPEPKQP